jgi:hypothetical protein
MLAAAAGVAPKSLARVTKMGMNIPNPTKSKKMVRKTAQRARSLGVWNGTSFTPNPSHARFSLQEIVID